MKILNQIKTLTPSIADNFFKAENTIFFVNDNIFFALNCLKHNTNYRYNLLSFNTRIREKTFINEIIPVQSIVSIFKNVDWWRREICTVSILQTIKIYAKF